MWEGWRCVSGFARGLGKEGLCFGICCVVERVLRSVVREDFSLQVWGKGGEDFWVELRGEVIFIFQRCLGARNDNGS